jgi:hypothetical protein
MFDAFATFYAECAQALNNTYHPLGEGDEEEQLQVIPESCCLAQFQIL